jgi:hypothetical protein
MSKKLTRLTLLVVLCSSLLLSQFTWVGAQKLESPSAQATPTQDVLTIDATEVPFRVFEDEDIPLSGPYDSAYETFAIPNSWALSPGAELHLDMTVNYNKISSSDFGYPLAVGGGKLTLYLNDTLLGVLNLNENGNIQAVLPLPPKAFVSNRSDGRMAFYAELDAGDFCYVDEDFSLIIHPTSYFSLPHGIEAPAPEIINLSKILYQGTFVQESALIVLPNQPSVAELQAALTVAGGLGNISGNDLQIDTTTMSALTPEQQSSNNLILVGRPSAFTNLDVLDLPAPSIDGIFQILDSITDAGVIQLVNSPWSASNVVVLVSGNSDAGVIKAAQAVSTGVIRPHRFPNLAVVENVQPPQANQVDFPTSETNTFASMGYSNSLFDLRGFNVETYEFQIPLGWTVSENAYFELAYGNSSLLDFGQSGIVVLLNETPIGSVRFDSETSKNAINKVKMNLPQSAIIPGENQLEIQAYIYPNDICTPPQDEGNWINIWNDSVLSTPLTQKQMDMTTAINLTEYPAPFVFDFELNSTAFVLPENDLDAWRSAVKIASYLASQANTPIVTLSAFYGSDFPVDKRQNYHVIMIGKPSQLPIVDELGQLLPVPFEVGSDKAIEGNMRVIFNIPEDVPLGYVELLSSPWNSENVIVAILGNTTQGQVWAASAMTDATLRNQISGNLLIVNGVQVLASDTRLFPISGNPPATEEMPDVSILATPEASPQPVSQGQNWIPLALIIGFSLIILIIFIVLIGPYLQRRFRR